MTDKTDNGETKDDYILLCRMPHAETGKMLLIRAGLTQCTGRRRRQDEFCAIPMR